MALKSSETVSLAVFGSIVRINTELHSVQLNHVKFLINLINAAVMRFVLMGACDMVFQILVK